MPCTSLWVILTVMPLLLTMVMPLVASGYLWVLAGHLLHYLMNPVVLHMFLRLVLGRPSGPLPIVLAVNSMVLQWVSSLLRAMLPLNLIL